MDGWTDERMNRWIGGLDTVQYTSESISRRDCELTLAETVVGLPGPEQNLGLSGMMPMPATNWAAAWGNPRSKLGLGDLQPVLHSAFSAP